MRTSDGSNEYLALLLTPELVYNLNNIVRDSQLVAKTTGALDNNEIDTVILKGEAEHADIGLRATES